MKELIERVRSFETDHAPDGWPAIRMREVSALADALADLQRELDNERARGIHTCHDDCTRAGCVNRRLREQVEELTAALAVKDEALSEILRVHANDNIRPKAFYIADEALAIQPHASILNKILADTVRELYDWFMDQKTFPFINEEAIETYIYQHIEKGEE